MPGRKCKICQHADRNKIDFDIASKNGSLRTISDRYNVPIGSLKRHKESGHVVKRIAKAAEVKEIVEAGTLLEQINSLKDRALNILKSAEGVEENGVKVPPDLRTACTAIREVRGILELLAKVTGELNERPQINILMSPEWITVRTVVLQVLEPYPEAKVQLIEALAKVEVQQP